MNNSPRGHACIWNHGVAIALLFVALTPLSAFAQVLDQQVNALLAGNCGGWT